MKKARVILSTSFVLLLGFALSGCSDKTASKGSNNSGNVTNPIGTTSGSTTGSSTSGSTSGGSSSSCPYGSPSEPGIADAGQSLNYYRLNSPPAVMHGKNSWEIAFSTASDLPSTFNQNIFYTDDRFSIRVIPRRTNRGTDSRGISCDYTSSPFKKMNIGVNVRSVTTSGIGAYHQFRDVPVDCPSRVYEFEGLFPITSDPLIIELLNVEWDYSCISHQASGSQYTYETGEALGLCPYDRVWLTECFEVEIQLATDGTKDLPGPRAN